MLTNEFLLTFIIESCQKFGITGYDIAKNTSISDQSAYKILNGVTKNPRRKNLLEILDYLENKIAGISVPGHKNYNKEISESLKELAEPDFNYNKEDSTPKEIKMIEMQEKIIKSMERVIYLENLLRQNNIPF